MSSVSKSIATGTPLGNFITVAREDIYQYITPAKSSDKTFNALIIYTDTDYIDKILGSIWFRNFIRWFVQAFLVSLVTVVIIRWGIFNPINKVVVWVKALRTGNIEQLTKQQPVKFLAPLHKEIEHIAKAMHEAKATAQEEARLRTSSEAIWTPERLKVRS